LFSRNGTKGDSHNLNQRRRERSRRNLKRFASSRTMNRGLNLYNLTSQKPTGDSAHRTESPFRPGIVTEKWG
jgi:hypothetical protein